VAASAPASGAVDGVHELSLPNSSIHYTRAQLNDLFNAPDWFPQIHIAMPDVVAHGRKPDVYACAFCHTPRGQGRPENAALAGLPASYIARQLEEMRSGMRKAVGPATYLPISNMTKIAAHLTDDEIRTAAEYFSKQSLGERVQIKETNRMHCAKPALWIYVEQQKCEDTALGTRIVEIAPDVNRHELRDETMAYIAFVPVGSIERGGTLTHRADPTHACATCHGEDLRGTDLAPPLAGRSPTYLLRQLVAFQLHTRQGERAVLMQPITSDMSMKDMIAAAAYAASLTP
jgi:cytochrome c553